MTSESGMILSIPQLRLCADTLGGKPWDDLPLLDTGEPVEQRLMNAFMKLTQSGYFLPEADGFKPTDEFAEVILHITHAKQVFRVWEDDRILAFFYEKDGSLVTICPDGGNPDHCRITCYPGQSPQQGLAQFPEPEKLRLEEVPPQREMGQYDLEKLALFFAETKTTEEDQ